MRFHKGFLILLLALVAFNSGLDSFRNGDLGDIPQHPYKLFVPPWKPIQAYASRNGDEILFWEYSKLALGEPGDLDYLASKRQGDFKKNRSEIEAQIRPPSQVFGHAFRLPYRDFSFEYPPLPLALMLAPRLIVDSLSAYRFVYGILASLLLLMACGLGVRFSKSPAPRVWMRMAWMVLALGPIVVSRFDILPALLVCLALACLPRRRFFISGVLMGAAAMAKLYPLLLLGPWVAIQMGEAFVKRDASPARDAAQLLGGAILSIAAISTPFLMTAPGPFLQSTFLYGARPYQIESLEGALMVFWHGKDAIIGSFGSYNVYLPHWVNVVGSLDLPGVILICMLLAFRESAVATALGHDSVLTQLRTRWTLISVLAILLFSKVFSPQFLIWLVPLAALAPDLFSRKMVFGCILVICGITQVYYPFMYDFLAVDGNRAVAALVVARDLLLLLVTASLLNDSAQGEMRGKILSG